MITRTGKIRHLNNDTARDLATDALIFLATNENSLAKFLSVSGYRPEDIRKHAHSPEFLAGVLDFILEDESMLLAFTANGNHDPEMIVPARDQLRQIMETGGQ